MKKLLTGLFLSGVLATGLLAQDGTYFCMMTSVQKGDESYNLTEKQMKQNTVTFTIKDHILDDGKDKFVYQLSKGDIDIYKNNKTGLAVGIRPLDASKNLYAADIAGGDNDNVVILGCKKIK